MKIFCLPLVALAFTACASNPNQARYGQEENAPRFSHQRSFVEAPAEVLRAARAVLDEMQSTSEPPVSASLSSDDNSVRTAWVHSVSKDKFVEYKADGLPQRKPLKVRRRYGYHVTPNLQGSLVTLEVKEETLQLDFKTGAPKGWKSEETDPAVYDLMTRRLKEKLRQRF